MTLDDGSVTAPAQVQVESQEPGRVVLRLTIYEGKNRQIRRMCDALGPVSYTHLDVYKRQLL